MRKHIIHFLIFLTVAALSGCGIPQLIGGIAQNVEYQKQIEVLAQYDDLKNKSVAVVVGTDLSVQFEHRDLISNITTGITQRLMQEVEGIRLVHPRLILAWQYKTPHWAAMPYGDITKQLGVDRVIYVDIYEYRLHPPGNQWQWEGLCAANVGVLEKEGLDPDDFVYSFSINAEFPKIKELTKFEIEERTMKTGLLSQFVKETAWVFTDHLEPKYPDKYHPTPARGKVE